MINDGNNSRNKMIWDDNTQFSLMNMIFNL